MGVQICHCGIEKQILAILRARKQVSNAPLRDSPLPLCRFLQLRQLLPPHCGAAPLYSTLFALMLGQLRALAFSTSAAAFTVDALSCLQYLDMVSVAREERAMSFLGEGEG